MLTLIMALVGLILLGRGTDSVSAPDDAAGRSTGQATTAERAASGADEAAAERADAQAGERAAGGEAAAPRAAARVLVPVRISDADVVRLLQPGDRVDVFASPTGLPAGFVGEARPGATGATRLVARRAKVAKVPARRAAETGRDIGRPVEAEHIPGAGGALVVLAVPPSAARELAGAAADSLSVALW
ncbi:RcpC/CpaB family pilus assembly protein [Streptomyces alkaliterrae]|uniref:RcpC/CpaB family pilus assembly protein n=1 Tax=Streptomyces alkaliterrae TaxID=2213162 RepID=UPI002B1EF286|nr:RcpC/CpaB family pilus assembly protein [Streptomyces alkaliterrae]